MADKFTEKKLRDDPDYFVHVHAIGADKGSTDVINWNIYSDSHNDLFELVDALKCVIDAIQNGNIIGRCNG